MTVDRTCFLQSINRDIYEYREAIRLPESKFEEQDMVFAEYSGISVIPVLGEASIYENQVTCSSISRVSLDGKTAVDC